MPLFVLKKKRLQSPSHMPINMVGQEAGEDMSPNTVVVPVTNRTKHDSQALQAPEFPFDLRVTLVLANDIFGEKRLGRLTCSYHIDFAQFAFPPNGCFSALVGKRFVLNRERKMLSHLVSMQNAADFLLDIQSKDPDGRLDPL
jgi:hypothetical protein